MGGVKMDRRRFYLVGHIGIFILLFAALGWPLTACAYESKSNTANGVRVEVQPLQLVPGQPAKFEVRMNMHSVDLSQDMITVTTLKDDEGRAYLPTNWEGSPPGGHHRRGILYFPTLEGKPKSLSLIIRDIASVPERIFEWNLKP
jgi:hypothetical protein